MSSKFIWVQKTDDTSILLNLNLIGTVVKSVETSKAVIFLIQPISSLDGHASDTQYDRPVIYTTEDFNSFVRRLEYKQVVL